MPPGGSVQVNWAALGKAAGGLIEIEDPQAISADLLLVEEQAYGLRRHYPVNVLQWPSGATKSETIDEPAGNFTWAGKIVKYTIMLTTAADAGAGSLPVFPQASHRGLAVSTDANDTENQYRYTKTIGPTNPAIGPILIMGTATLPTDNSLKLFISDGGADYISLLSNSANLQLNIVCTDNLTAYYTYMNVILESLGSAIPISD